MADKSDKSSTENGAKAAATAGADVATPTLQLIGQYVRDLSFENPGAPLSIMSSSTQPKFNVSINVQVNRQADDVYAVEISINAEANRDDKLMFKTELVYGGAFRIAGFTEAQLPGVLMVECPRLLFPFARQVLANITQAGGFPPLMMEPVDFAQIYHQNLTKMAEAKKAEESEGSVN